MYQLFEANFGLFSTSANGGGVALFAHVGGFVFGWVLARVLSGAGRITPPGGTTGGHLSKVATTLITRPSRTAPNR